mmetsp:Transcript_22623/g.47182  ORF Transcript_22623/g.47182 Transcript_22623/m.47182 type:complete len:228 (+) Transcript_22623:22-705(+)
MYLPLGVCHGYSIHEAIVFFVHFVGIHMRAGMQSTSLGIITTLLSQNGTVAVNGKLGKGSRIAMSHQNTLAHTTCQQGWFETRLLCHNGIAIGRCGSIIDIDNTALVDAITGGMSSRGHRCAIVSRARSALVVITPKGAMSNDATVGKDQLAQWSYIQTHGSHVTFIIRKYFIIVLVCLFDIHIITFLFFFFIIGNVFPLIIVIFNIIVVFIHGFWQLFSSSSTNSP